MRFGKQANAEPIPGYRLLELLGEGGFGEVWKCEAPGGLHKAIKFVSGDLSVIDASCAPADQELTALQHVKAVRHPFLLSIERIEKIDGELIIVTELADRSLHDLLVEHQATGLPGIPRAELLAYLSDAAEALDVMNLRCGLQHLDIKPRNLFLTDDHVKVGDYGLVNRLETATSSGAPATKLGGITPFYAAPEVLEGVISPRCDQYSLAVVYQELLTGSRPFTGKNLRQLVMQHVSGRPDLRSLPPADRPVVARALSKDWRQRFPSCRDFVRALIASSVAAPPDVPWAGTISPPQRPAGANASPITSGETLPAEPLSSLESTLTARVFREGYRFLSCLGRSPLGEMWEVAAPDGRERLARVVSGHVSPDAGAPGESIFRLESLEHPALPAVEVVPGDGGRPILVTDRFEKTLRGHLLECQRGGLPGIPRRELLGYLQAAAEALDYVYQRHSLQHLALNPCELVLAGGRLRVEGCGLVQLLWLPQGEPVANLNPHYAAPELLQNEVSRSCDQYSLALIYPEMLIGRHPFPGQGKQRSAGRRGAYARPDLDLLPATDRAILSRALHADPGRRFSTCTELVRALESATGGSPAGPLADLPPVIASPFAGSAPSTAGSLPADLPAAGRSVLLPGNVLQQRYSAWLPGDIARLKLDGFCLQWNAKVVHDDDDCFVLRVERPGSIWRRWLGRQPVLEVRIQLTPREGAGKRTEVLLQVRAFGCSGELAEVLISEVGPLLLDSLSGFLQAKSEPSATKEG